MPFQRPLKKARPYRTSTVWVKALSKPRQRWNTSLLLVGALGNFASSFSRAALFCCRRCKTCSRYATSPVYNTREQAAVNVNMVARLAVCCKQLRTRQRDQLAYYGEQDQHLLVASCTLCSDLASFISTLLHMTLDNTSSAKLICHFANS